MVSQEKIKQLFHKEYTILDNALDLAYSSIDKSINWIEAYKELTDNYKKLLGSAVKITKISDSYAKKLLMANEKVKLQKKSLQESNQKFNELNATKDKFFSIISHDLRGSLGIVTNAAEILASSIEDLDTETIVSLSKDQLASANHLNTLLENLLQWARLQMGGMIFSPKRLMLLEYIDIVLDLCSVNALNKDITLKSVIDDNHPASSCICRQ